MSDHQSGPPPSKYQVVVHCTEQGGVYWLVVKDEGDRLRSMANCCEKDDAVEICRALNAEQHMPSVAEEYEARVSACDQRGAARFQRHRDAWRRYALEGGEKPSDYLEEPE